MVSEWVRERIPGASPWEKFTSLGLLDDDQLIAGVIFDRFIPGVNIDITVAADGRRWLTRNFLHRVFSYPFIQLGVKRITALIPKSNEASERFCSHLGFVLEGTVREGWHDGDLLLYGMLKSDCRWLEIH